MSKQQQRTRGFWSVFLGFGASYAVSEYTRPFGWDSKVRMAVVMLSAAVVTMALYKLIQAIQERRTDA